MGMFNLGSSESQATDARVAGTDYARIASGERAMLTETGAVSVGEKANLNTGIDLTDAEVRGNIIFGDSNDILKAQAQFAQVLNSMAASQENQLATLTDSNTSVLDKVLNSVSGLSETKQTEGTSSLQKYGLWIILGGLALVAFIAWRK